MDYDFFPGTELKPLKNINLRKYGELVDEHGGERRLNIDLRSGKIAILYHAYDSIVEILDQLPIVKVCYDAHASGLVPHQRPFTFSLLQMALPKRSLKRASLRLQQH
jgi:hypothetical protein